VTIDNLVRGLITSFPLIKI